MGGRGPAQVVAPLQAKSVRVELDQRRDHVVLGQDALGSRCRAKQTFARAARWPAPRARCAWVESERGFPNRGDFDSTCWLGGGGQQEMAKPYSQDLRDRVIDAVKRGEMSRRGAARRYEISESVAIKWLERVERDGSREPVGHGGHR